jgi:hypothetical protein
LSDLAFNVLSGQWEAQRTPTVFKVITALLITAEQPIWTPPAGKRFRLLGILFGCAQNGDIILRDNTGGTVIARIPIFGVAGIPVTSLELPGNGYLSQAAAASPLTATGSVAAMTMSGTVFGTEE